MGKFGKSMRIEKDWKKELTKKPENEQLCFTRTIFSGPMAVSEPGQLLTIKSLSLQTTMRLFMFIAINRAMLQRLDLPSVGLSQLLQ